MSYCPVRASRAMLIRFEYILSVLVVCCLSIAQCAPILEQEPWFIPQVRPYSQTVLKFGLRCSATWWRGALFCHRKPVDRWVLARGIDHFSIFTPNHIDSSGFAVRISLRANPDDRVVIDKVSIGGRARPSMWFVITGCLIAAWNVVVSSWGLDRTQRRWSSCVALLVLESGF
jgi:hypothetical protein